MSSLAPYLHAAPWRDWFAASAAEFHTAAFWLAFLQIVFADLLLSGDNAVIIALACRGLPEHQRRWGIVLGAGVAVLLRVIFVGIIARLMLLPYLHLFGGVALLVIAAKLVVPDEPDRTEIRAVSHLLRAVMIIAVADIVMSLDNVIAIAALAQGNLLLLIIGLAVSIPLIMVGAAVISKLLDRFPILIWVGAALLGWVAGGVIATDSAVAKYLTAAFGDTVAHQAELAAASAGTLLAVAAGGLWSRLQAAAKIRANAARAAEDSAG